LCIRAGKRLSAFSFSALQIPAKRARQDLVFGIGMFAACAPRLRVSAAPQTGAGKRSSAFSFSALQILPKEIKTDAERHPFLFGAPSRI
jgi:hypothetical protein